MTQISKLCIKPGTYLHTESTGIHFNTFPFPQSLEILQIAVCASAKRSTAVAKVTLALERCQQASCFCIPPCDARRAAEEEEEEDESPCSRFSRAKFRIGCTAGRSLVTQEPIRVGEAYPNSEWHDSAVRMLHCLYWAAHF